MKKVRIIATALLLVCLLVSLYWYYSNHTMEKNLKAFLNINAGETAKVEIYNAITGETLVINDEEVIQSMLSLLKGLKYTRVKYDRNIVGGQYAISFFDREGRFISYGICGRSIDVCQGFSKTFPRAVGNYAKYTIDRDILPDIPRFIPAPASQ